MSLNGVLSSSSSSTSASSDMSISRLSFHGYCKSKSKSRKPRYLLTVRSVASDFAKLNSRANHVKVETVHTDHLDATVSAMDLARLSHTLQTQKKPEPTTEVPLDVLGKGRLVEDNLVYRQIFVIRSYEVGFDRTAPIETITNLFQETALNHVGMMDFVGDGMGTTHAMVQNRLIWIVTRMHIEMIRYPIWGDVVQIDSWVSSSGKNGMRRDFLVRDYCTGLILARATSNWAMMNQDTRKLSKMPDAVREEISPWFLDRSAMDNEEENAKRIPTLDETAPCRVSGLTPKLHDLDMNQHVNHVKYIDWLLESMPQPLLVAYEPTFVTLEYRRECGRDDIMESLASPTLSIPIESAVQQGLPMQFTHVLRLQNSGTEVLRGRTLWRPKKR